MHGEHSAGRVGGVVARGVPRAGAATPQPPPPAPTDLEAQSRALERASQAVVGVQALALEDARSNATLGRVRQGSGVVIGPDGLVLTIGYLVLEADQVQLVLDDDRAVPARVRRLRPGHRLRPAAAAGAAAHRAGAARWLARGHARRAAAGGQRRRQRRSSAWRGWCRGAALPATGSTASTTPCSPRRRAPTTAAPGLFNSRGELVGIGSLVVADTRADRPTAGRACPATCSCRPTCCGRSWPSCARAACPAPAAAPGWA